MRKKMLCLLALMAIWSIALFVPLNQVFADSTVVVSTPVMATSFSDVISNPQKWFFFNDENNTIDSALGSFVTGPATPLSGNGSAQISVSGTQRRNIATYQFSGQKLSDITTLKFVTYNPSAGNGGGVNRSAYLNFNVDFNGSDTWQRRLVFVPSANGTVIQDSWKEWDAINSGNALWTWSGFAGNGNKWPDNNTNANRTWSDLVTAFPDIRVRVTDSWFGLRVGEPYADGYTENIDSLTLGTASGITKFDFEPYSAPTVPVISTPSNGASVNSSALVKVDWSDSTGTYAPFEYQYEAFSDAGYTTSVYQSGWLSASEIPTPGTGAGTYYLRVRARDSVGTETAWSNDSGNVFSVIVTPDVVLVGPPKTVSECKNGGWQAFNNPSFPNQGQCVSYVVTNEQRFFGTLTYNAYGLVRTAYVDLKTGSENGSFTYADRQGTWYAVKVAKVNWTDPNLFFAGQVLRSSNPSFIGNWLFAKVYHNPTGVSQIWGSFTDEATAKAGVAGMSNPADGPFNTVGKLKVQ